MITKTEALKLAKKCWDKMDYCTEYENGYVFSIFGDRAFGGLGPVVVLNNTTHLCSLQKRDGLLLIL